MSIEVIGDDLSELNKEAGGHRIQRVPPTERKGRVHSSTVTVAVMDSAIRKDVEFNDKDFRIEWYSGTGAGGQHRNKCQTSCRIIHIATGVVSTAQCRSRENSLNEAKSAILVKLNDTARSVANKDSASIRKDQVGTGERGDKIRTYRFQDNLVKDHRSENQASIAKVLAGNFDLLW